MTKNPNVPESIQQQASTADALIEQLNTPQVQENPAQAAPQSAAAAASEQAPDAAQETAYWRHRFQVLQGKYNTELPAMRAQLEELLRQLQAARQIMPQQQGLTSGARASEAIEDMSAEELEQWGPELIQLIRRVASSSNGEDVKHLKSQVKQLRDEQQQDLTARFYAELERLMPDVREVNALQAFHQWLSGYDPLRGVPRQVLLSEAEQDRDAQRVMAIFSTFKKQAGLTSGQSSAIPAELIGLPQRTASGDALGGGYVWSADEISRFYRDKAAGRIKPEQARRLETDIFTAQQEGRIR